MDNNNERETAEFVVTRSVPKDVQDALDSVPKEMEAIDNSFEGMGVKPGDSMSTLTVLGEEYEVPSGSVRQAFLARDIDKRYSKFAATETVEELLIVGLEWVLAKELNGKSLEDCTWPEIYDLMQIHSARLRGRVSEKPKTLTKAEKKELLSLYAAEVFDAIYELEVFY